MTRILFLANHFITLHAFRRELIEYLIDDGYEVYLSLPESKENSYFSEMGCKIILTSIDRRGISPLKDLKLIWEYIRIINNTRPDIIFSYTIKPNIYGSMVANYLRKKQVCNITGTGGTFIRESFLSKIVRMLYRVSVKKAYKVYFQNSGDYEYFIKNRLISNNYELVPGSGVNLSQHVPVEMPLDETVNLIFIGRVMAIKGVDQYFACARKLHEAGVNANCYVAGFIEEAHYKQQVEDLHNKGIINYLGFQQNIDDDHGNRH